MDPGLDFAEALLDQLRRDLKRLPYDRVTELEVLLGRKERYLRRVSWRNVRLHEVFAAIRYLGYLPSEYVERLSRTVVAIPSAIPGFFLQRCPESVGKSRLQALDTFVEWGRKVAVKDPAPEHRFEVEARLRRLGFEVEPLDVLDEAESLLSIFSRHCPEALGRESALGLVRSLAVISEALADQDLLAEACELLDLGFVLEQSINDFSARHGLFRVGARLSLKLGYRSDALWCGKEALYLGLLVPDIDAVQDVCTWLNELEEAESGAFIGTPDLVSAAMDDVVAVLAAVESDRAASTLSAAELDRELGAKNAFSAVRNRGKPMTLRRWSRLLKRLQVTPDTALRKSSMDQSSLKMGGLFQRLKVSGPEEPSYPFQQDLLAWAETVTIGDAVPDRGFPAIPISESPFRAFPRVTEAFRVFTSGLPGSLCPEEAMRVAQELARAAYVLRAKDRLNAAADFLDAASFFLPKLEPGYLQPLVYRDGAYLSMHLGDLSQAMHLAKRSMQLEAKRNDIRGLSRSLLAIGTVAGLMTEFEVSLLHHKACWELPERGVRALDIQQNLAASLLRLGRLDEAMQWLPATEACNPGNDAQWVELTLLKAECLSRGGRFQEAEQAFMHSLELVARLGNHSLLAVVKLHRIQHFLDNNCRALACREGESLIPVAEQLSRNPVGQSALRSIALKLLRGVVLPESVLLAAVLALRFPVLAERQATA